MAGTVHICDLEGRSAWPKGADNDEAWSAERKLKTLCGLIVGNLPFDDTWVDAHPTPGLGALGPKDATCIACLERVT